MTRIHTPDEVAVAYTPTLKQDRLEQLRQLVNLTLWGQAEKKDSAAAI